MLYSAEVAGFHSRLVWVLREDLLKSIGRTNIDNMTARTNNECWQV